MVRLHTENKLSSLPGSAYKVCVVVVGGCWLRVNLVIAFSLAFSVAFSVAFSLSFSLALAKPNKKLHAVSTVCPKCMYVLEKAACCWYGVPKYIEKLKLP